MRFCWLQTGHRCSSRLQRLRCSDRCGLSTVELISSVKVSPLLRARFFRRSELSRGDLKHTSDSGVDFRLARNPIRQRGSMLLETCRPTTSRPNRTLQQTNAGFLIRVSVRSALRAGFLRRAASAAVGATLRLQRRGYSWVVLFLAFAAERLNC